MILGKFPTQGGSNPPPIKFSTPTDDYQSVVSQLARNVDQISVHCRPKFQYRCYIMANTDPFLPLPYTSTGSISCSVAMVLILHTVATPPFSFRKKFNSIGPHLR